MRILELSLTGFRNYESFSCAFDPGVNLILGENAQGKTNLLEAVCYLSRGSAFRTRKEAELIRFGAEFSELSARLEGTESEIRVLDEELHRIADTLTIHYSFFIIRYPLVSIPRQPFPP